MGTFGPKRVVYADDEDRAAAPPYRLQDNEYSVLGVTDRLADGTPASRSAYAVICIWGMTGGPATGSNQS